MGTLGAAIGVIRLLRRKRYSSRVGPLTGFELN
jgi:hypothetical protein